LLTLGNLYILNVTFTNAIKRKRFTVGHQLNIINAGFNAIGNNKWLNTTEPNGYIALKVVILQNTGKATAPEIIRPIITKQNIKVNLNRFSRRGSSSKNVVFSTSLEVAPHDISISNMCERSACEMCREIPPRKIVRRKIHFMFSKTMDAGR
jgi:hypothetical protein